MLEAIYAAKASQLMNEQTYQAWERVLNFNEVTPSDVKYAFKLIIKTYPDYPPTLGQFLSACLINKQREKQLNKQAKQRISKRSNNGESRDKAMEEIKKLLARKL